MAASVCHGLCFIQLISINAKYSTHSAHHPVYFNQKKVSGFGKNSGEFNEKLVVYEKYLFLSQSRKSVSTQAKLCQVCQFCQWSWLQKHLPLATSTPQIAIILLLQLYNGK